MACERGRPAEERQASGRPHPGPWSPGPCAEAPGSSWSLRNAGVPHHGGRSCVGHGAAGRAQRTAILTLPWPRGGAGACVSCARVVCVCRGCAHVCACFPPSRREQGFPGGSDSEEPACNAETWVQSLGREDSLEKQMATHIPRTQEPGGLQSTSLQSLFCPLISDSGEMSSALKGACD